MDSASASSSSCARCGKIVNGYSTRDGKGNVYCRACIERLCGSDAPARGASHSCVLCGLVFQSGNGSARVEGKGHYCSDCLARLHGRRPERRTAAGSGLNRDAAFDQMIAEIFEGDHPPMAMAG